MTTSAAGEPECWLQREEKSQHQQPLETGGMQENPDVIPLKSVPSCGRA